MYFSLAQSSLAFNSAAFAATLTGSDDVLAQLGQASDILRELAESPRRANALVEAIYPLIDFSHTWEDAEEFRRLAATFPDRDDPEQILAIDRMEELLGSMHRTLSDLPPDSYSELEVSRTDDLPRAAPILFDENPVVSDVGTETLIGNLQTLGATQVFTDVFIWNHALAASRLIEGIRTFSSRATGDSEALGIITTLSDDDVKVGYRQTANQSIRIEGETAKETYLDLDKFRNALREAKEMVERTRGSDGQLAVAVGWGHLAENSLSRTIAEEEGVIFIGPPAGAIEELGDKAQAKRIAKRAGVPMIRGSEGILKSIEEARRTAGAIGYPIALKAKAGGGGRGIRRIDRPEDLDQAFEEASREAQLSFNDSGLLMEQWLSGVRHIEIQVLADQHGDCFALGARDCTAQRRHQKVVESGAHETVPLKIRTQMLKDAVRLAQEAGYQNAGTVEFLYDPNRKKYFFMEMNTRLQVEHPVTEEENEIDLVALQLAVAMGVRLEDIFTPAQRHHFMTEDPEGFTLAVRVIAEDGWTGTGSTGVIEELTLPQDVPGLRQYFSVKAGSDVRGRADPQIGHLFIKARTRRQAINRMLRALGQLQVQGIQTNVDFLIKLLQSPEFQANRFHTRFLEEEFIPRHQAEIERPPHVDVALVAMAIRQYDLKVKDLESEFNAALTEERPPPEASLAQFVELQYDGNRYLFGVSSDLAGNYVIQSGKEQLQAQLLDRPGTDWQLRLGDTLYTVTYTSADEVRINQGRKVSFSPYDPTRYRAVMDGKIVAVNVEEGDEVQKGDPLYVLEAMKMENTVTADYDGVVGPVHVAVGALLKKDKLAVEFVPEGYVEEKGELLELPKPTGRLLPFDEMAERLFSGQPVLPEDARAGLVSFRENCFEHSRVGTYVEVTLDQIEAFWKRESQYGRNMEARVADPNGAWRYHLSRHNLTDQIAFIREILHSYRQVDFMALEHKLRGRFERVLEGLSEVANPHSAYAPILLEARRLRDLLRPKQELEIHTGLALIDGMEEGPDRDAAFQTFVEHVGSVVSHVIPLLDERDEKIRDLAGRLMLERTYRNFQLRKAQFTGDRNLLEFHFMDLHEEVDRHGIGFVFSPQGKIGDADFLDPLDELIGHAHVHLQGLRPCAESPTDDTPRNGENPLERDVIEGVVRFPAGTSREAAAAMTTRISAVLDRRLTEQQPKRVTLTITAPEWDYPLFQTFRPDDEGAWALDKTTQDFHPLDSELLELGRFEVFDLERLPSTDRHIHIFQATAKEEATDIRLSVRMTIPAAHPKAGDDGLTLPEAEEAFGRALDNLTRTVLESGQKKASLNNIFLNIETPLAIDYEEAERVIRKLATRYLGEFFLAQLDKVEVILKIKDDKDPKGYKRLNVTISNPTGTKLRIRPFVVVYSPPLQREVQIPLSVFRQYRESWQTIPKDQVRELRSHEPMTPVDRKRLKMRAWDCHYVYDYPRWLSENVQDLWDAAGETMPEGAVQMQEMVLNDSNEEKSGLVPIGREEGQNRLALVVWQASIRLPGEEEPYSLMLGSNDMTVMSGSMDMADDRLYTAAAYHAIAEDIPFAFFFAGSGARMIPNSKVGSRASYDPETGELYLTPADYKELQAEVIAVEEKGPDGKRYRLTGIRAVNQSSLSGSGMMIEASAAVSEAVPTFGVATGPIVVGKQTYAFRLLDATVQNQHTPVLLTGKGPINSGFGREAYTDDGQIGGPEVHAGAGVSHQVITDETAAMPRLLEWLRYQARPSQRRERDPIVRPAAPTLWTPRGEFQDRDISVPLLTGVDGGDPIIRIDEQGLVRPYDALALALTIFDEGSVREAQGKQKIMQREIPGYAPNVRVGRAIHGGIPTGFISFDARKMEITHPQDPARPRLADDRVALRAGRMWDQWGAYKTADWIQTINREGLPLVIMPNIRGFAGDATALYEDVVKHGANIVRHLRGFRQKVVIWMPPYAELRGGAWVVIDPYINRDKITFLVDEHATLGILEPEMMLPLPKVKRAIRAEEGALGEDVARRKWVRVLELADAPEVAVELGGLDAVVPTSQARRAIYDALVAP